MKTMYNLSAAAVCCAMLMLPAFGGCSSGYEVTSYPPRAPFVIDGKADDWAGHLLYYRDSKLTVGVSNDKHFLFVCAMSSDQAVCESILMRGLTVWIDSTGGKGKYFGVRFPLGMAESGPPLQKDDGPGPREDMMKRATADATKLVVLGERKDQRAEILLPGRDGFEARLGYSLGVFVYELKVPLGIEIADGMKAGFPDKLLGLRLETPESEMPKLPMRDVQDGSMADNDGGGMGQGGMGQGGQHSGGGHRPGGRGLGDDGPRSQSIDMMMKVEKAR